MNFNLPELPFASSGIPGFLSANTLHFHHDVHFKAYLDTASKLATGTPYEQYGLLDLLLKADGPLQKNAAQAVNHDFYFKCISSCATHVPEHLQELIKRDFGKFEDFSTKFIQAAVSNFGSGWTWLVEKNGTLSIVSTSNAGNPLIDGYTPLLCVDVWEHAYYLDFQNRRADYVKQFLEHINWDFVASNLK